jgi:ribosome-binding factor A
MTSRRLLKAAEAIREVVSMSILTELRDPRVQNVTVTAVEVAPDMRTAKIKVSVMGTEGQQHMCLNGLNRSAGFLQAKIAKRIDTRYTPRLTFELDEGVKKSLEMARLLHQLELERQQLAADSTPQDAQPLASEDPTTPVSPQDASQPTDANQPAD